MKKLLQLTIMLNVLASTVSAIELPRLFSDHMVLQRDTPIAVFGRGVPGEAIQAALSNGEEKRFGQVNVDTHGDFILYLTPLSAGKDFVLQVKSGEGILEFKDILIGDVWICSGQSNMGWTLVDTNGSAEEIAQSENSNMRLFRVARNNSDSLVAEVEGGPWLTCGPDTTATFSAVGYYFGKFLAENVDVPIGLIHTNWGGTMIESWTSHQSLFTQENPERFIQRILGEPDELTDHPTEKRINELFEDLNMGRAEDKRITALKRSGNLPIQPTNLYNGMIHPLLDFPIKGAIWYQGESNAGRAFEYRKLMPLMIQDWREQWDIGDFPFYLVQLANYMELKDQPGDSNWAELREAQSMTMDLPNTGMAVIIDIGEAGDIHPRNKRDVGYRLALQALKKTYGKDCLVASGPVLKAAKAEGKKMRLSFEEVGGGLVLKDQPHSGFELASEDGEFHWAEAKIKGEEIILKSKAVKNPKYVRYAWADNPYASLFNKEGLPASPFRTDTRPALTIDNRYHATSGSVDPGQHFSDDIRNSFIENPKFATAGAYRVAATGSDGNKPVNVFDGNMNSRWSSDGLEEMLLIDMGENRTVGGMQIATFSGDLRSTIFRIEASDNMQSWSEVFFGMTSGTTTELEEVAVEKTEARYLLLTFYGNTVSFWNSVIEIKLEHK